jgi:hypothetical protein
VLLKADVDKEEGGQLKAEYSVTALPSFVLLGPQGEVLGRIAGEQTEADFVARMKGFLKGAAADPEDQAVAGLEQRLLAAQTEAAARDISQMPARRLKSLRRRKDWRVLEARLGLARGQGEKAAAELQTLLALDDSCELAYDVMHGEKVLGSLSAPERKPILEEERTALERLAEQRLFVPRQRRCADFRSGVEVLLDVYGQLGLKDRRADLVRRAEAFLAGMGLKTGDDRNHDDDRRFFLELAGDGAALQAFYGELVAAYPSDYVYPYRFARALLEKHDAAGALRWAESADKLAYGANRLSVTKVRCAALIALGRKDEAAALLKRDIKAGQAFPQGMRALQELLDTLGAKAP